MEISKLKEVLSKYEFIKYMAFKKEGMLDNKQVSQLIDCFEKYETQDVIMTFTSLRVGTKSFKFPDNINNVLNLRKTMLIKYLIEENELQSF